MIGDIHINKRKLIFERAGQGLSASSLSKKAGLSKNVVSNIEKGVVNPRLETVGKIANALGKNIEDFIES